MKKSIALWVGVWGLALGFVLTGCSFSVNVGNTHVLKGKDKIKVAADRPAAPKPKPKPKRTPKKAKVVGKKIEITEKVMFEVNKADIQEVSHELLNDVAAVLEQNPGIKKIRIEGHTDSDGSDDYNKTLSQDRADSVMQFLVDAGVDEGRMEAVGYGEEKPIDTNDTAAGKEKNRRVEFNILEQDL
ncbi:MAG: OmpA family protein [Deltaproteobacteria bacterium]|nr:OmpA family protein [Deltaproteobacteria bacterium]MBN2672812.1 OmpA family protein [Deltaproteobacteria bacterium]